MNHRIVIAVLALFIIFVTALGAAFAAVSYYKEQQQVKAAAPLKETMPPKAAQKNRSQTEVTWSEQEEKILKPSQTKNAPLKETFYKLSVQPESLSTPDALYSYIRQIETELADQRQKCDDRKAIIELRYDQQDITAAQRMKDLAKIDFYKEQYTISVLQNIITLIEKSPCLTKEESLQQTQSYRSQLAAARKRSQEAKTRYEKTNI